MTDERFSSEPRFAKEATERLKQLHDPSLGDALILPDKSPFSFEHKLQPSPWSCIPTAFAMVLQRDPKDVITELGHDDARGFHAQELIGIALRDAKAFVLIEHEPDVERLRCESCDGRCQVERQTSVYGDSAMFECADCLGTGEKPPPTLCLPDHNDLLARYDGVLLGRVKATNKLHAVAWCSAQRLCLDPSGPVYGIESFDWDTFWARV